VPSAPPRPQPRPPEPLSSRNLAAPRAPAGRRTAILEHANKSLSVEEHSGAGEGVGGEEVQESDLYLPVKVKL